MGNSNRKSRTGHSDDRARHRNSSLRVERLECRRLLAGLNVSIFVDQNTDGTYDPTIDVPAPNRIVYVDLNRNGSLDGGEQTAVTDATGTARFSELAPGDYALRLLTNQRLQRQVEPVAVSEMNRFEVAPTTRWLLESHSPSFVAPEHWGLTDGGVLNRVIPELPPTLAGESPAPLVDLAGTPTQVFSISDSEVWIAYQAGSQSKLVSVDLDTQAVQLLDFQGQAVQAIQDVVAYRGSIYALVVVGGTTQVATLSPTGGTLVATPLYNRPLERIIPLSGLESSDNSHGVLVGLRTEHSSTVIELLSPIGQVLDSHVIDGAFEDLASDGDSGRFAVATSQATLVFRLTSDQRLSQLATLAEATSPLALRSGQLVSADRARTGSWIVWSTNSWLPISREVLADSAIHDVTLDAKGRVLALTKGAVHTADLTGGGAIATVTESDEWVNLWMGVEPFHQAHSLDFEAIPSREILEGTYDQFDLVELLREVDDDLWFFLDAEPTNGEIELQPDGKVVYTPADGYFGTDTAKVRITDGLFQTQIELRWKVEDINRPPTSITLDLSAFAENTPIGSELGFVTIVDPNPGESYRVTTSDSRFRVENGRLILDGAVDFETENLIQLEIVAIDDRGEFSITTSTLLTVLNSVEAPQAITLSANSVYEHAVGSVVGHVNLISPDVDGDYVLSVSDTRFAIDGRSLILVRDLSSRNEPEVSFTITATDRNDASVSTSETFTLTILREDTQIPQIFLSGLFIEERTAGAIVGLVTTQGFPDGDTIELHVSDSRFEIVDGVLKLKTDVSVVLANASNIPLAITASSLSGVTLTVTFPLTVTLPRSRWQNPTRPTDVNGDGRVSPLDALRVINYLNENGSGTVPEPPPSTGGGEPEGPPFFPDVNGDGRVSALDALLIINELNGRNDDDGSQSEGGSEPEGESNASRSLTYGAASMNWAEERSQRQRRDAMIDAELELLLEQLARDHLR